MPAWVLADVVVLHDLLHDLVLLLVVFLPLVDLVIGLHVAEPPDEVAVVVGDSVEVLASSANVQAFNVLTLCSAAVRGA